MALRLAGQDDNNDERKEQSVNKDTQAKMNPWDQPNINNRETRAISDSMEPLVSDVTTSAKSMGDKNIIITISGLIVYVLFGLTIAVFAWMAVAQKPIDIYDNIKKVQPLFSFTSLFIIIDSILVFVLFEKRISLIIFAFLLQPFYPSKRSKIVNGSSGIGALVTFAYIIGVCGMVSSIFSGVSKYGNIIKIEDPAIRRSVVAMLDQNMDNGKTYGQTIKNYLVIEDAAIQDKNGQTLIAYTGKGSVSYSEEGVLEVGGFGVDTALVFARDISGNYTIVSAQLGDKMLTGPYAQAYWTALKSN